MSTPQDVLSALAAVRDPELAKDLVSLNLVQGLAVEQGVVRFTLLLPLPARPWHDRLKDAAKQAVARLPGVTRVEISVRLETPVDTKAKGNASTSALGRIIAVASGKGGVGKSTSAVNLAVNLARSGARVGLLDADVYGPNAPMMLGIAEERPSVNEQQQLVPFERYGVKVMSLGFLVDPGKAVIWRGPMLNNLLRQFLGGVAWGELDYLVVDLPPGTGDAALSLVQMVPLSGAVVVTTPQDIALSDVRRSIAMFADVRVPVLGLVENMTEMPCPHCHKEITLYEGNGGARLAQEYDLPLLARIPFDPHVASGGDRGTPISISEPESEQARAFQAAAERIIARVQEPVVAAPTIEVG